LQIVILIIGFILGFGIGLFIYAQILLPLIYSLPKSIYLFFKGKLKFTAVIFWLVPPLIWLIILIGLGVVFEAVMPSVNRFLTGNAGFHLGQLLAIAALLIKFLSHKGRADIAEEYDRNTDARFRKDNQSIGAISTINLQDSQARHKSISQVRSEPPAPDQPDLSQRVDRIFSTAQRGTEPPRNYNEAGEGEGGEGTGSIVGIGKEDDFYIISYETKGL
jgi:hypothetical protein